MLGCDAGIAWAECQGSGAVSANIVGAMVTDPVQDTLALHEYFETVVKDRPGWHDLYDAT